MVLGKDLSCSLKLNAQLIVAGVQAKSDRLAISAANASERREHHDAIIGKLIGVPAHASVQRHAKHVATGVLEQVLRSKRKLALRTIGVGGRIVNYVVVAIDVVKYRHSSLLLLSVSRSWRRSGLT